MTESQSTIRDTHSTRKVSIKERACTIGNIVGVNAYRANLMALKQRLAEGGYDLHETPHFLLCTREQHPRTIVVHWFAPESIDADIGDYFLRELKPLGILPDTQGFGEVFGAVVCSLFPNDPQRALHLYGTNTLRLYQQFLNDESNAVPLLYSTIYTFAQLYQRIFQLQVGTSVLDVGCSFGFLPLLISSRFPSLTRVIGIDIQPEPFITIRKIAKEQQLQNIAFQQADVLSDNFYVVGQFDTVVMLHVLEHMSEAHMYQALLNLLKVTKQRLIVAVPFEEGEPEQAYGHEQRFTRAKLEAVGNWCVQQLDGPGKMTCEECEGGLLLIERIEKKQLEDSL